MTSISATPGSYLSPLQTLQDQLQSEVNSGAISASDQGALSSALNDISASLQNGDPAGNSTNGTASAPGDLKSKIDNLIANEVSSGKLTSDQATELQGVFKSAFAGNAQGNAQGPEGGGHAHHGHHGGHGGSSAADSSTSSTDDVLQQFLQSLQTSLSSPSSSPYGATGISDPSNSSSSFSALLINYQS